MNSRWMLLLVLFVPLSLVMLSGFNIQPRPVAQAARVRITDLATRVAVLEEMNVDLEARVGELERVVNEMRATGEAEADEIQADGAEVNEAEEPAPLPDRGVTAATPTPAAEADEEPTQEATDQPAEIPTEEPTEGPTPEPTEVPTEIPTEMPTEMPTEEASAAMPSLDDIEIDWGPLSDYFEISNVRLESQQIRNVITGQLFDMEVLAFDVEAKTNFMFIFFYATLHDEDNFELGTNYVVEFDPDHLIGWEPGMRSHARILIGEAVYDVATIQFAQS